MFYLLRDFLYFLQMMVFVDPTTFQVYNVFNTKYGKKDSRELFGINLEKFRHFDVEGIKYHHHKEQKSAKK